MSTGVIHKFIRQANLASTKECRVANRWDPFRSTLSVLEDPSTDRKLFLVGTTNSSTLLAYRTKKLIEEHRPANIYVQTDKLWWSYAKHIQAESESAFKNVAHKLPIEQYRFENNPRGLFFRLKYNAWLATFKFIAGHPSDFTPLTPGLEMKFALDEASRHGSRILFGGTAFDPQTIEALRIQSNMYPHNLLLNSLPFTRQFTTNLRMRADFLNTLVCRGGQAFSESIDRSRANFMIYMLATAMPEQKKLLIDSRDERIFLELFRQTKPGQSTVAVVNQWHMEGVETHWRRATGTQIVEPKLSPVADMDIDALQESRLINEYMRDRHSKLSKSEPSTWEDYSLGYNKNYEYERIRHISPASHEDVPAPGEKSKGHH